MARTTKPGIPYFSHDSDMMQDKKIKLIKAKHGLIGYAIFLRLLEELYREEGYYLLVDEDFNILFSDDNNIAYNVYIEVLNDCILHKLFNSTMYEKYSILTSKRIQFNYCNATNRRNKVSFVKDYLLIDAAVEYNVEKVDVDINSLNVDINSLNVDSGTQSKVEYIKEEKSIVNKSKKTKAQIFQKELENLLVDRNIFEPVTTSVKEFVENRKAMKKPMTILAVSKFLNKLEKETTDTKYQIELIDDAIANGWQTIYPKKDNSRLKINTSFLDVD